VNRWVSCLAVVPLLLDAYLVQLEHYVMAESLFITLLIAALALLLWRERPPWWAGAAAGLLLAYAAVTRTVGVPVLGVVGLYLLARLIWRSIGWPTVLAAGVGVVAILLPYVLWFHATTGSYALTDYTGHFLYGRVSNFAECDEVDVPARLSGLCFDEPPAERPVGDWYVWDPESPANSGRWTDAELKEFSELFVLGQPVDFATTSLSKTLHYFAPGHSIGKDDACLAYWQFPSSYDMDFPLPGACTARLTEVGFGLLPVSDSVRPGLADVLARYQDWGYVPGPALGLLVVVGLTGLVPHRRRGPLRDNLDAVACVAIALAVIAVPSATATFDYRYGLPILPLLPIAAALATRGWLARKPAEEPAPVPVAEEPVTA
jgi:4-amino-4-deoxy-L-arabinose transferase-like glycosyltransferase